MDLIQITKILKDKEKNRNKLLGQREMLMDSLKELGYTSIKDAQKDVKKLNAELDKMVTHYEKGESTFKSKYRDLLED